MKKYTFLKWLLAISVSALVMSSCAFMMQDSVAGVPKPLTVNTNSVSPYYVDVSKESITFTGDPAADFTSARKLIADSANDSTNYSGGKPTTNFHELTDIYFAYTRNNLFFGFKSPSYPDGDTWKKKYSGGSYLFIDNGITSGDYSVGPTTLSNSTFPAAGITGTMGSWEATMGETAMNGHKFSFFLKHYRPSSSGDVQIYRFINGKVDNMNSASLTWNHYLKNGVTEIQIPLHYVFGDDTTTIPDFYVAFRIDSAGTDNEVSDHADDGVAVDWAPNQGNGSIITNWYAITNL